VNLPTLLVKKLANLFRVCDSSMVDVHQLPMEHFLNQ
jgi:hypothetical protein